MKPNDIPKSTSAETLSAELRQLVLGLLGVHLRSFAISISDEGIVLRGCCESFHAKQMVQEIVAKSTSRRIVANELIVSVHEGSDHQKRDDAR